MIYRFEFLRSSKNTTNFPPFEFFFYFQKRNMPKSWTIYIFRAELFIVIILKQVLLNVRLFLFPPNLF